MGYIKHHTIIVTDWNDDIKITHQKAVEIFGQLVSPIIPGLVNNQASFFVAPDGSKEGWLDSDKCNDNRDKFITYMLSEGRGDFAEVIFGGDDDIESVLRSRWKNDVDETQP